MVPFLISILIALVILSFGELLRRKYGLSNEVSRKLVHSVHGTLVAIWPFFIGYKYVIILELLFIFAVFVAQELKWFRWLWRVGRRSWGQFLFPVGVIVAALLADSPWIYLAAVLELGLADAAAAVVGKRYAHGKNYQVFGQKKSVPGSLAFYIVSFVILSVVLLISPLDPAHANILTVIWLSAILTATENLGVYGSDNFLIPFIAVITLNALS